MGGNNYLSGSYYEELEKTSYSHRRLKDNLPPIADFDKYEVELGQRALLWAKHISEHFSKEEWYDFAFHPYKIIDTAEATYNLERTFFPTNKPRTHRALFVEIFTPFFSGEIRKRGSVDEEFGYLPLNIRKWAKKHGTWPESYEDDEELKDEYLRKFRFEVPKEYAGYKNLLRPREEELFPEPEPIRVEVAGAIINFTTHEAALVVYMDKGSIGKDVEILSDDTPWFGFVTGEQKHKAKVYERSDGGMSICAAIFNRIPIITDLARHEQTPLEKLKKRDCRVKGYNSQNDMFQETVTLFRENVAELDWRGRK